MMLEKLRAKLLMKKSEAKIKYADELKKVEHFKNGSVQLRYS
jgi:hypothetical protein